MPEHAHPLLSRSSDRLAIYFTLGMALNYQRDSYALWRACTQMFEDTATSWVFDPVSAAAATRAKLADALVRHRVALQPNRHPEIWARNASGLVQHSDCSVRRLFENHGYALGGVKTFMSANKHSFPYLCGPKILNYWLYVMSEYLDWPFVGRSALSVAPDRHVIAASRKLGLVGSDEADGSVLSLLVADRWRAVLVPTHLLPIDIHTPLWLWSRAGFPDITSAR